MDRIKSSLLLYFFLLALFAYLVYPSIKDDDKGQYYVFASIIFIGFMSYFTMYRFSQ